jgi:hypothetical protein
MRAQRLAVSGLAVVAIVAIAALGVATVLPDDREPVPPAGPGTAAPATCAVPSADVELPSWTDSANPPQGVPRLISPDGNVVAVVWSKLVAGERDDEQNKILWIMRQPRGGQALQITATLPESVTTVTADRPADSSPGEIYPSVVDVPAPGCWHFALDWNGHHSEINLAYAPAIERKSAAVTTSTTTTPPVTGTTCRTANLTVTLSAPNGAAGQVGLEIGFRNDGTTPCTMTGYPGVSFLDAAGHQIGVPAVRNPGVDYATVSVAPGETVYSLLQLTNPSMTNCPVSAPAKVRVFPPNETADVRIAANGLKLCATSASASWVNPVVEHPNF